MQRCKLFFKRTCVVVKGLGIDCLGKIFANDGCCVNIVNGSFSTWAGIKGRQTCRTAFGENPFFLKAGNIATGSYPDESTATITNRRVERRSHFHHQHIAFIRTHFFGGHHRQRKDIAFRADTADFFHQCVIHFQAADATFIGNANQ